MLPANFYIVFTILVILLSNTDKDLPLQQRTMRKEKVKSLNFGYYITNINTVISCI